MKGSIRTEGYRLQQIRKLTEVSRAITYAASLDEVFQLTVDRATDLLAAESSLLMVANNDGLLVPRASHGIDITLAKGIQEPLSEALIPSPALRLGAEPESFSRSRSSWLERSRESSS